MDLSPSYGKIKLKFIFIFMGKYVYICIETNFKLAQ